MQAHRSTRDESVWYECDGAMQFANQRNKNRSYWNRIWCLHPLYIRIMPMRSGVLELQTYLSNDNFVNSVHTLMINSMYWRPPCAPIWNYLFAIWYFWNACRLENTSDLWSTRGWQAHLRHTTHKLERSACIFLRATWDEKQKRIPPRLRTTWLRACAKRCEIFLTKCFHIRAVVGYSGMKSKIFIARSCYASCAIHIWLLFHMPRKIDWKSYIYFRRSSNSEFVQRNACINFIY